MMTTEHIDLTDVVRNITLKRESKAELQESNTARTNKLWRRASRLEWEYKGDFIRGRYEFVSGLPHVFEGTCPRYLMSNAELGRIGLKPGQAKYVAHTYNQQANGYYLYDVRDCQPINHLKAKARLEKAIIEVEDAIKKGYPGSGREILLQTLNRASRYSVLATDGKG